MPAKKPSAHSETQSPVAPNTGFIQPGNNRPLLVYYSAVQTRFSGIRILSVGQAMVHIDDLIVRPELSVNPIPRNEAEISTTNKMDLIVALRDHPNLVILGDSGSGKSTIVNWLTWSLTSCETHRPVRRTLVDVIPVPIILREANVPDFDQENPPTVKDVFDVFLTQHFAKRLQNEVALLEDLFDRGQLFFLFDGIDELSQEKREWVRHAWTMLKAKKKGRILLTSQIEDQIYHRNDATLFVAPFRKLHIAAFVDNFAKLTRRPIAKPFLEALAAHTGRFGLQHSPMELTVMVLGFFQRSEPIPETRTAIYKHTIHAFMRTLWEITKEHDVTPSNLLKALCDLAWDTQADQKVLFPESTIVAAFQRANINEGATRAFLKVCRENTRIVVPRGTPLGQAEEHYMFVHLAFRNYLAAQHLLAQLTDGWTYDEKERGQFSRENLAKIAVDPYWKDTFVFLFETLGEQPGAIHPESFAGYLFDERMTQEEDAFRIVSWSRRPEEIEIRFSNALLNSLMENPGSGFGLNLNAILNAKLMAEVKEQFRRVEYGVGGLQPNKKAGAQLKEVMEKIAKK